VTKILQVGPKTFFARAYLSYCQLEYVPQEANDTRYAKLQLILVGILTTLCVSARNDFLILNKAVGKAGGEIELWRDALKYMKCFFCCPEVIVDKNFLMTKRNEFFSKGQWWYDPTRGIARNHQNPSNYSEKYRSANHLQESAKWKIGAGPRLSAINATAAMMSSKSPETSSGIRPSKERGKLAAENQKVRVQKDNDAFSSAGFKQQSGGGQKRKAGESSVTTIKSPPPKLPSKLQKSSFSTPTIVETALKKISSTPRSHVSNDGFGPHVQAASFAVIRNQIAHDGEVAELQMRERNRLQIVEIELARKEQRARDEKEREETLRREAKEREENLRNIEKRGYLLAIIMYKNQQLINNTILLNLDEYLADRNQRQARVDLRDREDAEMTAIRIQRAKLNMHNEQVVFHGQVQELKDAQNDARVEKHMKLKHSLQETSLDSAHHRSMAFVTEKSNTLMAMTGLQTVPQSFASFRRELTNSSTNNSERPVCIITDDANKHENKGDGAQAMEDKDEDDDGDDTEEKEPWMV